MLQGILNFRFTNNLFETEWSRAGHRAHRHHAARDDRRREARRVLRRRRRAARRRPEPPAADARAGHDGAARVAWPPTTSETPAPTLHRVARADDAGRGRRQHLPRAVRRLSRDRGRRRRTRRPRRYFQLRTRMSGPRWAGVPRDDGGRQADGRGAASGSS